MECFRVPKSRRKIYRKAINDLVDRIFENEVQNYSFLNPIQFSKDKKEETISMKINNMDLKNSEKNKKDIK